MKQLLFLAIVSILVIGKVYGQSTTYATLADRFNEKAKVANKKDSVDWGQELRTVFTIYLNIPETVIDTLSPTATSTFCRPVEIGLNKFPYDEVAIETNANLGVILTDQRKVNDLYNEISEGLLKKATPEEAYNNIEFTKFLSKKLESSRLKTIGSSLHNMKAIRQKFETLLFGELSMLGYEKTDQVAELEALLAAVNNAQSAKDIDDAIASFKKAQRIVLDRLKIINGIMAKYYGERNKCADFLIGLRKTMDTPLQPDQQLGMWETGLKILKKSPSKLKKMVSRK